MAKKEVRIEQRYTESGFCRVRYAHTAPPTQRPKIAIFLALPTHHLSSGRQTIAKTKFSENKQSFKFFA